MLSIEIIPLLKDNYAYVITDRASQKTAVVDPSEAGPILSLLSARKCHLDFILNTHHHNDHCGGNLELKAATQCTIVGPGHDKDRIPGIDIALFDGETFTLGNSVATIIHTPGHTRGQVNYWFKDQKALFTGDTLFSLGCGRMFEGNAEQMWATMKKLRALPTDTRIYCGHEYTLKNAQFALTIDPNNTALNNRRKILETQAENSEPSIPALLGDELKENPFLRPD